MEIERRYARTDALEFRAATTPGSAGTMVGYALKYDRLSQNLGGFVERVAPGAVDKSLADGLDVLARYNHDDAYLLGRTASGTLRLTSDETGLRYEIDLPDTTVGRDVAALAARGDIYQSSFAFYTVSDEWGETEQGYPLRSLTNVRLVDVAPVNTPAYLDTEAGLRSFAEARGLDMEAVREAAARNELRSIVPVEAEPVADADAEVRAADTDPAEGEAQGDSHATPPAVLLRLMELDEMRRTF